MPKDNLLGYDPVLYDRVDKSATLLGYLLARSERASEPFQFGLFKNEWNEVETGSLGQLQAFLQGRFKRTMEAGPGGT